MGGDNLLGSKRFHHPFTAPYEDDDRAVFQPNIVVELTMNRISVTIRQKELWWQKMRDPTIRATWIREVREQEEQNGTPIYHKLTEKMLDYLFNQLEDHATMMEESHGIQLGPHDRIWFWDNGVRKELTDGLVNAVEPLENVPDSEKDWHPGSNQQVLDIVHPSMYPLVYGHTYSDQSDTPIVPPIAEKWTPEEYHSNRFLWLPSDFSVSSDGKVKLVSPYINNIHPIHQPVLVPLIESIMQEAAIPLWERVLSDLRWTEPLTRFEDTDRCIWHGWQEDNGGYCGPTPDRDTVDLQILTVADEIEWQLTQPQLMTLPEVPDKYEGDLKKFFDNQGKVNLAGRTIQVIVKLANIVLTPAKSEYPGGKWHVEGMNNEHIVATFIYYYDSQNIQDATLNFRRATADADYHFQDDEACTTVRYGYQKDEPCVQDVGGIRTKQGSCLAFPNLYQHQVSPFTLVDPTQPGHRKILVFFLVDPTCTIPSATNIPIRQIDIHKSILLQIHGEETSRLANLPVELVDYIASLTPGTMTRQEAEKYREDLINERVVLRDTLSSTEGLFGKEFNMCEH